MVPPSSGQLLPGQRLVFCLVSSAGSGGLACAPPLRGMVEVTGMFFGFFFLGGGGGECCLSLDQEKALNKALRRG